MAVVNLCALVGSRNEGHERFVYFVLTQNIYEVFFKCWFGEIPVVGRDAKVSRAREAGKEPPLFWGRRR